MFDALKLKSEFDDGLAELVLIGHIDVIRSANKINELIHALLEEFRAIALDSIRTGELKVSPDEFTSLIADAADRKRSDFSRAEENLTNVIRALEFNGRERIDFSLRTGAAGIEDESK